MSTIGLIDYGMGNLHSVQRAFERLGCRIQAVTATDQMQGCDALEQQLQAQADAQQSSTRTAPLLQAVGQP